MKMDKMCIKASNQRAEMSIKLHLSTTASQSTRVPNAFSSSITHIAATHLPKASLSFRRPVTNGLRIGAWAKSNIASIKTRRPCTEVVCSVAKLEEVEAVSLDENPRTLAEKLPSSTGVYAMFDKANHLQFIGISRRLSDTVLGHLRDVPHLCGSVKIATIEANDRAALTEAWKVWMEEHINSTGKVPPGNESGNDTWVRKQKTTSKADLRLTPGRHVQLTVSLEQLIDKLVKENEVVAFIKGSRVAPQCGFSHRVLTMLNENGVVYESVDVLDEEHNPGLREALKMYSGWPTFPQVFVRGELVGGADILTEMSEKGELRKLFGNKG